MKPARTLALLLLAASASATPARPPALAAPATPAERMIEEYLRQETKKVSGRFIDGARTRKEWEGKLPRLKEEFLAGDPNANGKAGLLTSAFLVSYMLTAPVFGWLADRSSRWIIVGASVAFWSLASGASGLAGSFAALLATRVFLGVGEAGYGPAAPTIISDLYPVAKRGLEPTKRLLPCARRSRDAARERPSERRARAN